MRKFLRWLGYGLGGLAGVVLIFAGWVWYASASTMSRSYTPGAERLARPTPELLANAERQGRILGCVSCHGEGLTGRKMFDAPGVATVWAPNLTEVAARATDQQLAQAIRQGVGADGHALYIMPSQLFARLSDQEVAALVAWIRSVPRRGEATPDTWVGPMGRFGIAMGRFQSAPERMEEFRVRQPYDLGADHASGRRLAATACADCHGPDLSGGHPGPDTIAPGLSIAAAYDLDQFRTLLRTGRPPNGRDLGLMETVARQDFSNYTDAEIGQLHAYLRARAERVQDPPVEQ